MSYCRWSENSDVYIYDDGQTFVCCTCTLGERHPTYKALIEHVELHISLGDKVPFHVLPTLQDELERYARYCQ